MPYRNKLLIVSVCLMLFTNALGESLTYPLLPELFKNVEDGLLNKVFYLPREVYYSLSYALFPLGCFIGMPLLGALSDKYGRQKIMLNGLIGLTLNYLMSALAVKQYNIGLFLLTNLLNGFFAGTYTVGMALVNDFSSNTEQRLAYFKLLTLTSILGFILGPSLALLNQLWQFENQLIVPFLIAGGLGIFNVGLLAYNFYRGHRQDEIKTIPRHSTPHNGWYRQYLTIITMIISELTAIAARIVSHWHQPLFKLLASSCLLCGLSSGLFVQSISWQLSSHYHYTTQQISVGFMIISIFNVIGMYIVQPWLTKYMHYQQQIKMCLISLASLLLVSSVWQTTSQSLTSHLYVFWLTVGLYQLLNPLIGLNFNLIFINSAHPQEQGQMLGLKQQTLALAWCSSGLVMGQLIKYYQSLLLVAVLGFVASYLVFRRYERLSSKSQVNS